MAPRQKAVAVGPVSERRTKIPELPIASAPPNSATSAETSDRDVLGMAFMGRAGIITVTRAVVWHNCRARHVLRTGAQRMPP